MLDKLKRMVLEIERVQLLSMITYHPYIKINPIVFSIFILYYLTDSDTKTAVIYEKIVSNT